MWEKWSTLGCVRKQSKTCFNELNREGEFEIKSSQEKHRTKEAVERQLGQIK